MSDQQEVKIYVYDQRGILLDSVPDSRAQIAIETISDWNNSHPDQKKQYIRSTSFPPPGTVFDPARGTFRSLTNQEQVLAGMKHLDDFKKNAIQLLDSETDIYMNDARTPS